FSQRLVPKACAFCAGEGCEKCEGRGHLGRVAVIEILDVSDKMQEAIRQGASEQTLRQADPSFRALRADVAAKVVAGLVRPQDAIHVQGHQEGDG
ncbi:MAG: hypothetical protein AAF603_03670, partial [Pseudomonadota bacterium]